MKPDQLGLVWLWELKIHSEYQITSKRETITTSAINWSYGLNWGKWSHLSDNFVIDIPLDLTTSSTNCFFWSLLIAWDLISVFFGVTETITPIPWNTFFYPRLLLWSTLPALHWAKEQCDKFDKSIKWLFDDRTDCLYKLTLSDVTEKPPLAK